MAEACNKVERANKSTNRGSGEEERGMGIKDVRSPTDAVTWPVGNASRGIRAATGARLGSSQRSRNPM